MKLVSIDELDVGMVLAEDIINDENILVLKEGTILEESHIRQLFILEVEYVYIHLKEEISEDQIKDYYQSKQFYYSSLNEECQKTRNITRQVFLNVKLGRSINCKAYQESITPLIEHILIDNDILAALRNIEKEDELLFNHSINVCLLSTMIGKWLDLDANAIKSLAVAAILHDIGIVTLNDHAISSMSGENYKYHTISGYNIIKNSEGLNEDILKGILYHHVGVNGEGYPEKLSQTPIPLYAKIIAVADQFDRLVSGIDELQYNTYRAIKEIRRLSFSILDPEITSVFIKNIKQYYIGNKVLLNNGETGEVVWFNPLNETRPLVKVKDEFIDLMTINHIWIKEILK